MASCIAMNTTAVRVCILNQASLSSIGRILMQMLFWRYRALKNLFKDDVIHTGDDSKFRQTNAQVNVDSMRDERSRENALNY